MVSGEFDEEILEIAVQRREVLAALASAPHHRQELQDRFDISKTTCHRIVRSFDELGLLRRTDSGYELSHKGGLVEQQVDSYYRTVRAACELEPLAAAFDRTGLEFDVELFSDARITRPDPDNPTVPLNREFELFEEAETFRTIDGNQYVPPLYLEQLFEMGIERGMRGEHITTKEVAEQRLSNHPEIHKKHSEVDAKLRYRIHDDIPFGLVLYDDSHVIVRAYDDETGSVVVMADTDDPAAIEWASAVVDHYRGEAEPPSAFDDLPDWTPDADIDF